MKFAPGGNGVALVTVKVAVPVVDPAVELTGTAAPKGVYGPPAVVPAWKLTVPPIVVPGGTALPAVTVASNVTDWPNVGFGGVAVTAAVVAICATVTVISGEVVPLKSVSPL